MNNQTLSQSLYYYRIDYLAYMLLIICFFGFSLISFFPSSLLFIAIFLAWLPLCIEAIRQLKNKKIGNEFFLAFATIFAVIGGQERVIMIVLIIMLIAEYIETIIESRTESALENLLRLIPSMVTVVADDHEKTIPLSEVTPGMTIIIKTGGTIPVDGKIVDGSATINEAALTGESTLQEKSIGNNVFAGTFIESGSLVVMVEKIKEETLFGKMTELLQQAEKKKAHITIFTDKVAFIFTPTILCLIGLVWLVTRNTNIVITLLVFGSPLELALITPLTILAGTVAAFRHGILVKSGLALERLAQATTMIFDKTGTLTLGQPTVVTIESFDPTIDKREILWICAIAEKRSEHIFAKALLTKAHAEGLDIPNPETYKSLVAHGVEITFRGKKYLVGSRHFIEAQEHGNVKIPETRCIDEETHSSFYLASQDHLLGKICVADTIRADAKVTIDKLRATGISDIILLSGDRQEITSTIARQLGIQNAYGNVFPDQKLKIISDIQKSGQKVIMAGDGINDAPALKQADAGIAMGAMGVAQAIQAADLVLMTNELEKVVFLRKLAQKIVKVIKQNLIFGFLIFHSLGIILTLAGYVDPIEAAGFHALSDIIILINSGRLINFKG